MLDIPIPVERQRPLPHCLARLARVLHEHQLAVAAAYPRSVTATGFLGADAARAAVVTLQAVLDRTFPARADTADARRDLLAKVGTLHAAMLPAPAIATANDWVHDTSTDPLVVTWNLAATPRVTVDGRAAAPAGVAGMGSHTTAWKLEVRSLNGIVAAAASEAETIAALADAVRADLLSDVMDFAVLLPADQIEAGQLETLIDAAADVLTATTAEPAAKGYLQFRNLLPFATVDEGSRSGHGEGSTDTLEGLFDGGSLQEAADLLAAALGSPDGRRAAAEALAAAAETLTAELKTNATWSGVDSISTFIPSLAKQLRRQAAALLKPPPSGRPEAAAGVAKTIMEVRSAEHRRVWEDVYT